MENELLIVKNIGTHLSLDQISISTFLNLYKHARIHVSYSTCLYGCSIIVTKLSENFRKIRDVVNAITFELDGQPCMELEQYLKCKSLMLESEISVMKVFNFNLSKFRANEHYSLLFSVSCALKLPKYAVQIAWSLLNQSYLSVDLLADDYPEAVAGCLCLCIELITLYNDNVPSIQASLQIIQSIPHNWYENFYFREESVLKAKRILKAQIKEDQ